MSVHVCLCGWVPERHGVIAYQWWLGQRQRQQEQLAQPEPGSNGYRQDWNQHHHQHQQHQQLWQQQTDWRSQLEARIPRE